VVEYLGEKGLVKKRGKAAEAGEKKSQTKRGEGPGRGLDVASAVRPRRGPSEVSGEIGGNLDSEPASKG